MLLTSRCTCSSFFQPGWPHVGHFDSLMPTPSSVGMTHSLRQHEAMVQHFGSHLVSSTDVASQAAIEAASILIEPNLPAEDVVAAIESLRILKQIAAARNSATRC